MIHKQVHVRGSLATGGELDLNPNLLGFSATGSVGESTLMGWTPIPVTFRELGPDPAGKGRRAFEIVGPTGDTQIAGGRTAAHSYVLVLAPDKFGPHRLVVKDGGAVRQLLPLVPYDPEYPAPHAAPGDPRNSPTSCAKPATTGSTRCGYSSLPPACGAPNSPALSSTEST